MQTTTEATDLDALLTGLSENYDAEIRRIEQEIRQLDRNQDKFSKEAADLPELESFLRVKQREADDLTVQGKREEAAKKLDEGEQMKAAHKRLEDAWNDCARQIAALESDKRHAARKVLDEWLPTVLPLMHADQCAMYAKLDKVEAMIKGFIEMTGNNPKWGANAWIPEGINPDAYTRSLVASEGESGELRKKWFTVTATERHFIREK